jgi:hypothetical protein
MGLSAVAAAATVQLVLEPRELQRGQTGHARVVVAWSGTEAVDASKPPVVPSGAGAQVRFSGQTGRSNRIVQGRISKTLEFDYVVVALTEGSWTLGPVEVGVGATTVRSEPATLVVRSKAAGGPPDDFEVFAGFEVGGALVATADVWEGQVLTYRRGLRYRTNVSARFTDPKLEGFRTLQEGDPTERRYTLQDEAGELMVTEGLLPVVASGVGRHDLGPATAAVQIPIGRRFGMTETRTEVYASEPLSLTVRPLPPPPPGFSGLVGDLELRSSLRGGNVKAGDSVPFTLVVSGGADLEGLKLPDPVLPGVSVYPSEPVVKAVVGPDGLAASATFQWALVPTQAGRIELPPYELVVFSPRKGAYDTLRVALPALEVAPGKDGEGELRAFGVDPGEVSADDGSTPRAPYAWGFSRHYDVAPALLGGSVVVLAPALALLAADGLRAAAARWRRRRPAPVERPPTARELVASLPDAPDERLAVLDHALRVAEAGREGDGRFSDLRKRLGRARFGGGVADPGLEDDVRRLIEVVEREAA